jgi:14-3-3 protein epsilon
MAAISQGAARKKSSDLAVRAYMHASILAVTDLSTIHPDRLRLALNYSTFLHDTAEETDQAYFVAKRAMDNAQAEVDSLETDVHPDSIRLIGLLWKRNVSRSGNLLQTISLTCLCQNEWVSASKVDSGVDDD